MVLHRIALASLLAFAWAGFAQAYEEGYPFNQYKTYKYNTSECGSYFADIFDKGPYKASCRITQLSHIINMGDTTIRKFVAISCARGESAELAKFNARAHARELISEMQRDDLKARGRQPETDQMYVSDNSKDHCVLTGSPNPEVAGNDPPPSAPGRDPDPDPPRNDPPPAYSPPPPDPTVAVFILHNRDRYRLGVQFVSKTRDAAWPGNDRQYNLSGSDTYRLNCREGEKICFGAWRDHQTTYWGVGRGNEGCTGCCIQCGGTLETNLSDGGEDAFPNTADNSVNDAIDVLSGVLGVMNGIQQMQPRQQYRPPAQQYRAPPTYNYGQGKTRSNSDITGTR